jgi:carbamoyl-phosphate synthase large subunit
LEIVNIMLTCVGRRNYLVRFFQNALDGKGLVIAADASGDAPALQEADRAFVVPLVSDPNYFDVLLSICRKYDVRLLISLNDLELPRLAHYRQEFNQVGTLPVVSEPHVIDTCFDKWQTCLFLERNGFDTPATYLSLADAHKALAVGELVFPVVVKPRWGTASIGIEYAYDANELDLVYELVRRRLAHTIISEASAIDPEHCVMIQQKLSGHEYGLDVINNLDAKHVVTFAKHKLSMRAGETDRAVTVDNPDLIEVGDKLGSILGHVGNLDCDVIVQEGTPYILEMNPRFGGGYPFSHVAGANIPAAMIAWVSGKPVEPEWLRVKPNVRASKCDRLVVFEE